MSSTLISIIIPLYNHRQFVAESLDSIFQQTYNNLELIVVDDGSTDDSGEIAQKILLDSPYPYQFIQQKNKGAHAAINRGIQAAKGDYLAILNSDDRYVPRRIEVLYQQAKKTRARFLFSGVRHINADGMPLAPNTPHRYYYRICSKVTRFFPTLDFELLRHNRAITSSNFFFHTTLVEEIGEFASYITCHDWDYLLRVMLNESPKYIDQVLLDYRVHPGNTIKRENERRDQENDQVISNYLSEVNQASNPLVPGPAVWGAYWPIFREVYLKHFNHYPRTKKLLQATINQESVSKNQLVMRGILKYQEFADRGFNQFIWQEQEINNSAPDYKMQLHRIYVFWVGWLLGKIACIFK